MKQRLSRKIFHICMILVLIVIIAFVAMMFILNYEENGETNMPFVISKISIISQVNGEDIEDSQNKWNFNVVQNNDIYINIKKNDNYKKQETISSVKIEGVSIGKGPIIGSIKTYRPAISYISLTENIDENLSDSIEFTGSTETDSRSLKISNQGGTIAFRLANTDIGTYVSNEEEEINHNELLKKLNIKEENLKFKATFDITLKLDSGKVFKAEDIELELPVENIVEEGTVGKDIEYLDNIIFKRIEN